MASEAEPSASLSLSESRLLAEPSTSLSLESATALNSACKDRMTGSLDRSKCSVISTVVGSRGPYSAGMMPIGESPMTILDISIESSSDQQPTCPSAWAIATSSRRSHNWRWRRSEALRAAHETRIGLWPTDSAPSVSVLEVDAGDGPAQGLIAMMFLYQKGVATT